jgi:mycothiol system anti-sigma-R factor
MSGHKRCQDTLAKLQTFLDRELSEDEIGVVHYHLEQCPPCEKVFKFEQHLRRLVRVKCCADTAPEGLRDQILAKLRKA